MKFDQSINSGLVVHFDLISNIQMTEIFKKIGVGETFELLKVDYLSTKKIHLNIFFVKYLVQADI